MGRSRGLKFKNRPKIETSRPNARSSLEVSKCRPECQMSKMEPKMDLRRPQTTKVVYPPSPKRQITGVRNRGGKMEPRRPLIQPPRGSAVPKLGRFDPKIGQKQGHSGSKRGIGGPKTPLFGPKNPLFGPDRGGGSEVVPRGPNRRKPVYLAGLRRIDPEIAFGPTLRSTCVLPN